MPLRITILSGDRQGQMLEFDQAVVTIGDSSADDVVFDRDRNPGIRDRRAMLKLEDGKWKIECSPSNPVLVNQEAVRGQSNLRSGDFIRMSHDGPDLAFELIGELSPVVTIMPGKTTPSPVKATLAAPPVSESTAASPAGDGTAAAAYQPSTSHSKRGPLLIGAAIACVLLFVAPLALWLTAARSTTPPQLDPFGVIVVKEGEKVFWRPTLSDKDDSDRFELGSGTPTGMTIDPITGTLRWTTTEADGPGEYRCELIVTRFEGDQSLSDREIVEIQVTEVNRPPVVESVPIRSIDLRRGDSLTVTLQATDPDLPRQNLSYRLDPGAPDGVQLDPHTGQLHWTAEPALANQTVQIPFRVRDDSTEPLESTGVVRVRVVMPDPWAVAEQELRQCIYLLVAETKPAKLIVPLGTACAISEKHLLTSASVAHGINDATDRDWRVLAVDTRKFDLLEPSGWQINQVQSHAAYVRAGEIDDPRQRGLQQAYFDLAILTTDQPLPKSCNLGDVELSAKNDQPVACFGFEVQSDSLSRFDSLEPFFAMTKILEIVPPPNEAAIDGRPPLLLQLIGNLPFQPFGSVIVNEDAEVLGVYAFEGQLPDGVDSEPIHYAVDSVHAKAFLAGQGLQLWIMAEPKSSASTQP